MTTSNATVTTSNMELTPMRVTFGGVDLGGTLSNVTVATEFTKAEIKADQSGGTVRDRRVSGLNISVTTELAEIKNLDIWKVVFPHAQLVDGGIAGKSMLFTNNIGDSDLANAKQLLLHPLSLQDADLSGDFKFFKACADAKSEIVYGPTEQAKMKIIWNILPDDSVLPNQFFIHGDPTIGVIAASAGTPVYTGIGNGTMSGVAVYSGFTKTETITATCVGTNANAGNFDVEGTLSGPLGIAVVGVNFNSPVISFLINDGTTDFVQGDVFTIPTVASNYV